MNDRRNEQLSSELVRRGLKFFEGEGKGSDPSWPAELSYLIVGISRAAADDLADSFCQNAYVAYSLGGVAELVWRSKRA